MLLNFRFQADSNPSLSATQSEVQRNPRGFLSEMQEIGGISRFLLRNRTGESVLLDAGAGFLRAFSPEAT
jgi:hypothetical protein